MTATPRWPPFPQLYMIVDSSHVKYPSPVHLTSLSSQASILREWSSRTSRCSLPSCFKVRTFQVPNWSSFQFFRLFLSWFPFCTILLVISTNKLPVIGFGWKVSFWQGSLSGDTTSPEALPRDIPGVPMSNGKPISIMLWVMMHKGCRQMKNHTVGCRYFLRAQCHIVKMVLRVQPLSTCSRSSARPLCLQTIDLKQNSAALYDIQRPAADVFTVSLAREAKG